MARAYKDKLAKIGLDAQLQRHGETGELELEPIEDSDETDEEGNRLPGSGIMVCPNCEFKQPRADVCSQCGAYIHKVIKQAAEIEANHSPAPANPPVADAEPAPVRASSKPATRKKWNGSVRWLIASLLIAAIAGLGYLLTVRFMLYSFLITASRSAEACFRL